MDIVIKDIKVGEELSYDYGYMSLNSDDFRDHVCKCGSKKCIGFIIASDDRKKYLKFIKERIFN